MKCQPIATIEITIPEPTPMASQLLRMQWFVRAGKVKKYAKIIRAQVGGLGLPPAKKAKVIIDRHSPGNPDWDGVVGGCKLLLDALTARHPSGAGVIEDDKPACIGSSVISSVKCKKGEAKTTVTVEIFA